MIPSDMKDEMRQVLEENILHFWLTKMVDETHGGFYGRMDGQDRLIEDAPKGAVLNARILWAFSAAYRVLGKEAYRKMAVRAKDYFLAHFIDRERGGVYWMLDCKGNPIDTKKQTYAIGFAIYGLSEFYRATGDDEALQMAIRLYRDIEKHAFDPVNNGYIEALTQDWQPIEDMRLSDKDENGSFTMNTHLHILEPYTNLLRVWPDEGLRNRLCNLIDIFVTHILNTNTFHLDLFFDNHWQGRRDKVSCGHDIEAAWLLTEALNVLNDQALTEALMPTIRLMAQAAEEGIQPDGSMCETTGKESARGDRVWWVQCECIIGEVDQWQYAGDARNLDRAKHCWNYVRQHLIDWKNGEWLWSVREDGSANRDDDKAGPWKCPYHNTRACLEISVRLSTYLT